MQDRLAQLRQQVEVAPEDVEAGGGAGAVEENYMADFFQEVEQIKSRLTLIRANVQKIKTAYDTGVWASVENQDDQPDLEALLNQNNKAASEVRDSLKKMKEENDALEGDDADTRIRRNMHVTLSKKFVDIMQDFQGVQTDYKTKYRERIQRQAEIVEPNITREEVDEIIETGNADKIFSSKTLDDRRQQAQQAFIYITEQQRDLRELERSIHHLHQMFIDMATIVEAQGELLDQVEHNISNAVEYTSKAVEELRKADHYQKSARKKCCIVCVVVGVAVAAAGAGLAAVVMGVVSV